jgi:hypothetical protein
MCKAASSDPKGVFIEKPHTGQVNETLIRLLPCSLLIYNVVAAIGCFIYGFLRRKNRGLFYFFELSAWVFFERLALACFCLALLAAFAFLAILRLFGELVVPSGLCCFRKIFA